LLPQPSAGPLFLTPSAIAAQAWTKLRRSAACSKDASGLSGMGRGVHAITSAAQHATAAVRRRVTRNFVIGVGNVPLVSPGAISGNMPIG
jgi:hypothetical protein